MDSLTQGVLGASVAGLWAKKLGKKVLPRGIVIGTIPDLDVFLGGVFYGSGLEAALFHRGPMHSILFCIVMAFVLAMFFRYVLYKKSSTWWSWFWLSFFVLLTHVLLDSLTNYGTYLFWPFADIAVSLNTIFIVDPLYTLPLLLCVVVGLFFSNKKKIRRICQWGLVISSLYLVLSLGIKRRLHPQIVQTHVDAGLTCQSVMTNPEPFQLMLWKSVAHCGDQIIESWYHILLPGLSHPVGLSATGSDYRTDGVFVYRQRNAHMVMPYANRDLVDRVLDKTKGYYIVRERDDDLLLYDMRFGRLAGREYAIVPSMFRYRIDMIAIDEDDERYEGGFPDGTWDALWQAIVGPVIDRWEQVF